MATDHTTTCSDCFIDLTIDLALGTVVATVPSNGLRGSKHVPAHQVVADANDVAIEGLIIWDCPACGYADSLDTTDDQEA